MRRKPAMLSAAMRATRLYSSECSAEYEKCTTQSWDNCVRRPNLKSFFNVGDATPPAMLAEVRGVVWSGAAAGFDRRQNPPWRHLQARQPLLATSADQRRQGQSVALEGDQRRSLGHRAAPAAAEPGRCGGVGQQDRAHRLGVDAP